MRAFSNTVHPLIHTLRGGIFKNVFLLLTCVVTQIYYPNSVLLTSIRMGSTNRGAQVTSSHLANIHYLKPGFIRFVRNKSGNYY